MGTKPNPVLLLAGGPGTRSGAYRAAIGEVLRLAGKRKPSVAYLGAANDDDPAFSAFMEKLVESAGPCNFQLAPVVGRKAKGGTARAIVHEADVVFVGGGDVELGMQRLLECDLAESLRTRHGSGAPFFGVSAGTIMLGRQWIRWRNPDDDGSAELFECLGLAPVLCDCHGEEEDWAELKALLRLAGGRSLGYGLRVGSAVRVAADGSVESVCGGVDRFEVRKGRVRAL
jgi:peptidase E